MKQLEVYDDVWIPTQCRRCTAMCGILAHRVNGVAVRLEGNPDTSCGSRGGLCPKGLAGLQLLYDPNRLNVPLRRTNPEKGLNVDPRWKEISWDEALDEISAKLKGAISEDPSKILIQSGVSVMPNGTLNWRLMLPSILSTSKGKPSTAAGGTGTHCGNGVHITSNLNYGAWGKQPDWKYCRYMLQFGTNTGYGVYQQYANRLALDALARGMKLVVFDPVCNFAAAKATEWVPILPGTDAAVCLAMLNVIVNELGICDAVYLKNKTNAAYLLGPDGRYVRDRNNSLPMVWDTIESKAKSYDDPGIGDFDLDGTHEVNGIECRPVWQVLKQHFKKYTPDLASEISTVPASTIRRIATEFAEAAMIGASITIDGKQLPFRPVATYMLRGAGAHQNAANTVFTEDLLGQVLGAVDVPGGNLARASNCQGYPGTGLPKAGAIKDHDGFLTVGGKWVAPYKAWPMVEPAYPRLKDLRDLFVLEEATPIWGVSDNQEVLRKAKIDPTIEVLLNYGCNAIMNSANPGHQAEFLKKIPFIVDFELFSTEFNEGFADIVLPDTCYLEYSDWGTLQGSFFNQPPVQEPWCFHITQKVVEPQHSRRHVVDVTIELLDRMGLRSKFNEYWNDYFRFDETLKLKPTDKITWEQLGDRVVRQYFGPEHDWVWFKKHGFISWPKKVEEVYWRNFSDVRVPIYREFMIDLGEKIPKIAKEIGIEMDWKQYSALPEWFPCLPHLVGDPQYDLYCFCFRDPLHVNSSSMEQPWLDEASKMNPYTYNITMSADMAQRKALKEGDIIELESDKGNKVQGVLQLRKGQHPQTITIMGTAGHWASGLPIARGKGVNFNSLMELRWGDCDPISLCFEICVKVKVTEVK